MIKKIDRLSSFSKWMRLFFCITLFIVIVLLPSINNTTFVNSTISSKTVFFIKGLIILSGIGFVHFLFFKKLNPIIKISRIDIALFIFVLYILLNRYIIQDQYGFSLRFIELIGLCFFYLIIRILSIKIYLWLLLAVVLSGIIQVVYGSLQLLGYYASNHAGFKMTGSFLNPGPYAGFLIAIWPIALALFLFRELILKQFSSLKNASSILNILAKYAFEYIPLLGVVSIVLILPVTQSRAAWLAFLMSSIILLELRYHFFKNTLNNTGVLKKVMLIGGTLIIIGIGLFGVYQLKKGSSDGRLFIWKVSTGIIKESPVFGMGFDSFRTHYMNNQANYFNNHSEAQEVLVADNTYYAFNEFVQLTVENGIIGFILLIIVLFNIFGITATKENKHLFVVTKINFLAIGIFAFFSYPLAILPIKIIIVFLLAITGSLDNIKIIQYNLKKIYFKPLVIKTLMAAVSVTIILISVKYINNISTSYRTWNYALSSYQYRDYENAIETFEEVYPMLKSNGEFLMNYGKALSISKHENAVKILEQAKLHLNTTIIETALGDAHKKQQQYSKAEKAYRQAADMIPTRFYPLYLLAKLYEESGQKNKAIKMAKNILKKDIKVPSKAIEEMQEEVRVLLEKENY